MATIRVALFPDLEDAIGNREHDQYGFLLPWRLYLGEKERKQRNKKPSKSQLPMPYPKPP